MLEGAVVAVVVAPPGDKENVGGAPSGGLLTNANGGDGIGFPFPGVGALFCMTICDEGAAAAVKGPEDVCPKGFGGLPPFVVDVAVTKGLPVLPPPNCPNGLAAALAGGFVTNGDAWAAARVAAGLAENAETNGVDADVEANADTKVGAAGVGAAVAAAAAGC